jgi:hypothetical protein
MSSQFLIDCPECASSGGFYGITVAETDGSPSYPGIVKVNFNSSDFYITQNDPNTDEVVVNFRGSASAGSGEANTASNLGSGSGIFAQKVGVDLQFKSLVAGTGITLTPSSTDITIDSAGSGGFYGLSVKLDNDAESFKGINTIAFDHSNFYITQNSPNIDEVLISFREPDLGPVVASITSSSPSSTLITTLPVRSRLGIINMKVLQAFNGTPTLTIGTDADNDLVSADSEIDLTLAFSYISMFLERFEASTDLKAFFTNGGATQGQLDITVSIN